MNKRIKLDKGITLIGLIITIIVLLILAGVTISMLIGDNGILKKAENAKVVNEYETLREEIALKIMDISAEVIKEEGRTIKIEDLSKISNNKFTVEETSSFPVIVTTEKYEYEINEKYEVVYNGEVSGLRISYSLSTTDYTNQDVIITVNATSVEGSINIEAPEGVTKNEDGTYTVTGNGTYIFKGTDTAGNERTKEIIINNIDKTDPEDFTPTISEVTSFGFKIISNATDKESGIKSYEYHIGDQVYTSTSNEYLLENLESETEYSVYVIVTDKAGNTKKSNEITQITKNNATLLEYPLLTTSGVKNMKVQNDDGSIEYIKNIQKGNCTASDAVPKEAWDDDNNSYFTTIRNSNRYLSVDSAVINSKMKLNAYIENTYSALAIYFYDSEGNQISRFLYYGQDKNAKSWDTAEKELVQVGSLERTIVIPENTYKIGLATWDTTKNSRIYNISIEN